MRIPGFLTAWRQWPQRRIAASIAAAVLVGGGALFVGLRPSGSSAPSALQPAEYAPVPGTPGGVVPYPGTSAPPTALPAVYRPGSGAGQGTGGGSGPGSGHGPVTWPTTPPHPQQGITWTSCGPDAQGSLVCSGRSKPFQCITNQGGDTSCSFDCTTDPLTGETSCRGSQEDFACSTDASTGDRGCRSAGGSWTCATFDPNGDTRCSGRGSFVCYAPFAGEQSTHCERTNDFYDFWCVDHGSRRGCSRSSESDPDCYFEPIFGAYCRDL
jgi:hypothetical protein